MKSRIKAEDVHAPWTLGNIISPARPNLHQYGVLNVMKKQEDSVGCQCRQREIPIFVPAGFPFYAWWLSVGINGIDAGPIAPLRLTPYRKIGYTWRSVTRSSDGVLRLPGIWSIICHSNFWAGLMGSFGGIIPFASIMGHLGAGSKKTAKWTKQRTCSAARSTTGFVDAGSDTAPLVSISWKLERRNGEREETDILPKSTWQFSLSFFKTPGKTRNNTRTLTVKERLPVKILY